VQTPPADVISNLPSLLPWGGGALAAVLVAAGVIWRGGLEKYLRERREYLASSRATDLAIATANANTAGSLERAMMSGERSVQQYDKLLTRHEDLLRRHESIVVAPKGD
jgi:hypothetical protein